LLATVKNDGAGREDPDADFQKSKRFIPNEDTRQKQRMRLSRISEILLTMENKTRLWITNKTIS